jgi:hypothetical protein
MTDKVEAPKIWTWAEIKNKGWKECPSLIKEIEVFDASIPVTEWFNEFSANTHKSFRDNLLAAMQEAGV